MNAPKPSDRFKFFEVEIIESAIKGGYNPNRNPDGTFAAGGSYGELSPRYGRRGQRSEIDEGAEYHHMPAHEASVLHERHGPAIRMSAADHARTASYGTSTEAREYRQQQRDLIRQGKFREAQAMDIADIRSKFGSKYDHAISQMEEYTGQLRYDSRTGMPRNPTLRQRRRMGR